MRVKISTDCARELEEMIASYIRAVDTSGNDPDDFEAAIDFPTKVSGDVHDKCRVSLCFRY